VTTKALNAQAAGAVGVVIMNEGTTGRTGAFTPEGSVAGLTVPVVGTAYDVGVELASTSGARLRLVQEIDRTPVVAPSIVVETAGDPDDVVMVGAHLDGAPDGPGMNDNASGSAALLALAERLAGTDTGATIRFAWWAGEELGLLGSNAYVADLPQAERDRIVAYLNVDMIASPNARFEVYDGDGSGRPPLVPVPDGSAAIERVLQGALAARGESYVDSELDAASDYVAFAEAGIPIGGLFTGASGAKSDADAGRYGGLAGVDYDLCYHQACDSLITAQGQDLYEKLGGLTDLTGNINLRVLDLMADTFAAAAVEIAANPGLVTGVAGGHQP
jgi:aminopeptidase Y